MFIAINLVADREVVAIAETREEAVEAVRKALEAQSAKKSEIKISASPIALGEALDLDFLPR